MDSSPQPSLSSITPAFDRRLAFAILRLTLGVNIFLHGATRVPALAGGALLMTARVFGAAPRQQWSTVSAQLVYVAIYYGLHLFVGYNRFSLDARLRGRRA